MVTKLKYAIYFLVCAPTAMIRAQATGNDTIMVEAEVVNGKPYPIILLPEVTISAPGINGEEFRRLARLRGDVFRVYPYAIAAASVLNDVQKELDSKDRRRDRKQYLKSIDRELDVTFKEPLKALTIDQGHILIKLVDRQTGRNCFSIIREFKSTFAAVAWQSVGVFFNNSLTKRYDPEGDDAELERIVKELEASNLYRYELFQQQQLLSKVKH